MKKLLLLPILLAASFGAQADLTSLVHKKGVKVCDTYLSEIQSTIKGNYKWDLFHNPNNNKQSKSVVIKVFTGSHGDTVHMDYTLQQVGATCYYTKRATITAKGICTSTPDANYWHIDNNMAHLDYLSWVNKGGVQLYTKQLGNICLHEYFLQSDKISH